MFGQVFSSEEVYNDVKDTIKEILNQDFSARKIPVVVFINGEAKESTLGKVLINLFLMKSFSKFRIQPSIDDYLDVDNITQEVLDKYFNHIILKFRSKNIDINYDEIRSSITETMNEMCDASGEYNVKAGNSISYRDFIRIAVEDSDANKLFHPEVKQGSFNDIEQQFKKCSKNLMNYFKENKDTELHPFVSSETGINAKQFGQLAGFVGLKPDMDGSVIPVTITDNFLRGLSSLESYYINSKGTRKALTVNNRMTKKSGYLTRKLELSNIDHYHDNSIHDCGTNHFVIYNVNNEQKFKQIIGRHYYLLNDTNEKISDDLYTVTKNSTEIIGTKIGLRSPVTCASKHVCATCYGRELSAVNKDINTGLTGTLKLTEPLTQRLLSAKHLLSTNTERVNFGDFFNEIFTVNMNSIYFQPDVDCTVSFIKPTTEEYDEDEEAFFTTTLNILMTGSKKAIEYKSPVKLYINSEFLPIDKIKNGENEISINSKSVEEEQFVFKYPVENNELTRSLQEILDLIEKSDHLGITNYHDFVNKFCDLLIQNDLGYINAVHIEMISAVLICDAETGKRLDFSKKDLNEYIINRVSRSVMNGPLAVSLSFERLNDQLANIETYDKEDISVMDNLFL